jgi:hypothetical protein
LAKHYNLNSNIEFNGLDSVPLDSKFYQHHQADIENLNLTQSENYQNPLPNNKKFDLIFSRMVFRHLVDPASALIQAFKRLKLNGILVIDQFRLRGCEAYYHNIINYLRDECGVRITAQIGSERIDSFVIQKTDPEQELKFPLTIASIEKTGLSGDKKCKYRPLSTIIEKDSIVTDYDNAKNFVKDKAKTLKITAPPADQTFIELIQSDAFKNANPEIKYMTLLMHVCQNNRLLTTTPRQLFDEKADEFFKEGKDYTYLTNLVGLFDIEFESGVILNKIGYREVSQCINQNELHPQLESFLKYAALKELVSLSLSQKSLKDFDAMGLSFSDEKKGTNKTVAIPDLYNELQEFFSSKASPSVSPK